MENDFYKKESLDIVSDSNGLKSRILSKLRKKVDRRRREIVYGVYNNENLGWKVKLMDFFIDKSKVSIKEKSIFFRLLFRLLDSGMPINQALKILISRAESVRFARIINTMLYYIEGGMSFSDSMKRFREVFDDSEIGIVKSGEQSGKLKLVLSKLSDRLEERNDLLQKLFSAALYPIIVLSVLLIVVFVLLIWVFPSLISLFEDSGISVSQLPFSTRFLLGFQTFIISYWWLVLIGLSVLFSIFMSYKSSDYGRMNYDLFKLKVPFLGLLLKRINVYKFVDLLALLSYSYVPFVESLEIISSSYSNSIYKLVVDEMLVSLKAGEKISTKAMEYSEVFPYEVGEMLKVAENSASISEMSEKIADQYKMEIDMTLKRFTSVFEPLLIILVGFVVAVLALSIMGPIFNLSSLIGV